jgi:peptide deformylase
VARVTRAVAGVPGPVGGVSSLLYDDLMPDPSAAESTLPQGGTVRPITRWGDPVMHRKLEPIETFDDDLRALAADMVATMYAADGVGLAACQIGVDRAIFVFDCPDDTGTHHQGVVCNPVLLLPEGKDRKLDDSDEGCLSLPGAFVPCARPDLARVEGQDLGGNPVTYTGGGLLARCLQHEADHCDGTVFGDRLNRRARKKLFKEADSYEEEYPPHWPAEPPTPTA